jgi:isopentenyldiphosphate isomerase
VIEGPSPRGTEPVIPVEIGVLVDEDDHVVGSAPRSEIRSRNLLHRGVAVMVRDPSGRLYVHRRTSTKDVFPSMYDATVGGMVVRGESYEEAARREVAEELGIDGVEPRRLFMQRYSGPENNAWMAVFEVVWDGPVQHQEDEIDWGDWMSMEELRVRHEEWSFAPDHLELLERYVAER